jgi:hypothetical protein
MQKQEQKVEEIKTQKKSLKAWLKKIGVVGFMFFLIKGLVWLYIFFQAGKCAIG